MGASEARIVGAFSTPVRSMQPPHLPFYVTIHRPKYARAVLVEVCVADGQGADTESCEHDAGGAQEPGAEGGRRANAKGRGMGAPARRPAAGGLLALGTAAGAPTRARRVALAPVTGAPLSLATHGACLFCAVARLGVKEGDLEPPPGARGSRTRDHSFFSSFFVSALVWIGGIWLNVVFPVRRAQKALMLSSLWVLHVLPARLF